MRFLLLCLAVVGAAHAFLASVSRTAPRPCAAAVSQRRRLGPLHSASPSTSSTSSTPASSVASAVEDGLVLGLNKYSHDSAVCVLSNKDGRCLFAGEKERLTRAKHDGGDTGELVSHALSSVGASLADVRLVVSNNHHHRVAPFEERIPWAVATGVYPESYGSAENLLPEAAHVELSHHLAHAWSAAALAPFDSGLIVVMDGMGESHGAMAKAEAAAAAAAQEGALSGVQPNPADAGSTEVPREEEYYNDLRLMRELGADSAKAGGIEVPGAGNPGFQQVPAELLAHEGYREAESAYTFVPGSDGGPPTITPIFKRWTRERSPPELYNHGFENMESMGAVYSRVSSHIFGDWNACGKVMGLAPWTAKWPLEDAPPPRLTSGSLLSNGADGDAFRVNWEAIEQLPRPNELGDEGLRPFYAALAGSAQRGLEEAAMEFIAGLKERTGEKNVCLCGGVALNSVLNGKVAREGGFERVFVPPCPGDEGIAIGCASFGWHQRRLLLPLADTPLPRETSVGGNANPNTALDSAEGLEALGGGGGESERNGSAREGRSELISEGAALPAPFWGRDWTAEDVEDELEEWAPWLDVRDLSGVEEVAKAIADGAVVAWFQGRGEFGPRALGCRSLLADPRDSKMPSRINTDVKKREDFRPFAPSVLAEEAGDWFEGLPPDGSPYMSLTAPARPGVAEKVPAVCHVDGSSRLQTVREENNPLYHRLIAAFFSLTGVPMILNTSFNVMGEPIVNSPEDAIRALVRSTGAINMLVIGTKVVSLKKFPPDDDEAGDVEEGLGGEGGGGVGDDPWNDMVPFQARSFLSEVTARDADEALRVRIKPEDGREEWIELQDGFELEILQLADGSLSLSEIIEEVVEDKMTQADEDEIDNDGYEWGDDAEDNNNSRSDGSNNSDGEEDEEAREEKAVAAITEAVLVALRSLYSQGLLGFD